MNTLTPVASGKIITFYSYKGGTGRTMAMANVAWILACNGKRVLVIDWDLEAPGLHRYFRPFLPDPELSDTPGLIDFFVRFWEATRVAEPPTTSSAASTRPWFYDYADLLAYAVPLDYEFPHKGELHFVGAGRQGASYASRVNWFRWDEFYEKLGGGVFLERVKEVLKAEYDYVLIDSRTGLSDTSGICTVQMPDELVVCFTLNRQSIEGAAATAWSADLQRRLSEDRPGLKIWPVPMRVELAEHDRLAAARLAAREKFAPFLWHISPNNRPKFLGSMEVLYFPYYAYEEILAPIVDRPGQANTLSEGMELLTTCLAEQNLSILKIPDGDRAKLIALYEPVAKLAAASTFRVFIGSAIQFHQASTEEAASLGEAMESAFGPNIVFWEDKVPLGTPIQPFLEGVMAHAELVFFVSAASSRFDAVGERKATPEVGLALSLGKKVIPVMVRGASQSSLPPELQGIRGITAGRGEIGSGAVDRRRFVDKVSPLMRGQTTFNFSLDPDDPNKGQFGSLDSSNGRQLAASVSASAGEWFVVDLSIVSTVPTLVLDGEVEFHLHPTFRSRVKTVKVVNGIAKLRISAWGAFTVGAVADGGATRLELDLAALPDAPKEFTSR